MKSDLLHLRSSYKRRAVIFVSANNDIAYSIAKAAQYDFTLFVVTENINVYQFMQKLKLKHARIIYLSTKLKRPKKVYHWLNEYKYLSVLRRNVFSSFFGYDIIFRAHAYDLLTCSLVVYLAARNNIFFEVSEEALELFNEHWSLSSLAYSIVYRSPLIQYEHIGKKVVGLQKSYALNARSAPIPNKLVADVFLKYSIGIRENINYVLILDDGDSQTNNLLNYDEIMAGIIKKLQQLNIEFMVKTHPRYRLSNCFKYFDDHIINNSIPVEFIDSKNMICIIGHYSIALANYANSGEKVVSLINILEYTTQATCLKEMRKKYLSDNDADHRIEYINDLSGLF